MIKVKKDIYKILENAFIKLGYDKEDIELKFSAMPDLADFQCNSSFKCAKKYAKKPFDVANEIVDNIEQDERFSFFVSNPAYVNIKLTDKGYNYYANFMKNTTDLGVEKVENPKKIIMDYGGANVAKALHMGHLRSPIIGQSLKNLLVLKGNEVYSDVHLGDFGLQMGLTVAQLEEDGYLDYFFKNSNEKPKLSLELLNEEYPKASARKHDEDFKKKADDYTLKIQKKMQPYYDAYKLIREVSVKEIKKYYELLNTKFDFWFGESEVGDIIDDVVQIFVDKGLAYKSNGALVCDVAEEGEHIPLPRKSEDEPQLYKNPMPPVLLKKYNGGDLYATTDIATVFMRNKEYKPDEIIYVADSRQKQHFTQFFRACKKSGISPESQKLTYVSFGTMNGTDGKPFKTRSGDTVKLEDVVNLVTQKANSKLEKNGIYNNNELAREVGVSALKFGDLINSVNKDYICDLDKFLSFEGKTGPYIQYNGARIQSILEKADIASSQVDIQSNEERKVILNIFKLIESYDICLSELSLNSLCLSLYDVANAFALLYNNIHILSEKDEKRKASLLGLCELTLSALKQGLDMLAIDMPKKM